MSGGLFRDWFFYECRTKEGNSFVYILRGYGIEKRESVDDRVRVKILSMIMWISSNPGGTFLRFS